MHQLFLCFGSLESLRKRQVGDLWYSPVLASHEATWSTTQQSHVYLLEGIQGDLQATGGFFLIDLYAPVNVLKDKPDRLSAAASAVDDVALFVHDDGGNGRPGGLQLQLWKKTLTDLLPHRLKHVMASCEYISFVFNEADAGFPLSKSVYELNHLCFMYFCSDFFFLGGGGDVL